jgi:hypothetical protein
LPKLIGLDPSMDIDLGVSHGDEIFTMFYQETFEAAKSEVDKEMSRKIINLW